jgi:HEAT repeat protein
MTKTLSLTVALIAASHIAMAQSVVVPPRPAPAPAPQAVPSPSPLPAVPVPGPFPEPPLPAQAPFATVTPAPPAPPAPSLGPFDLHFDDFQVFDDFHVNIDPSLWGIGQRLDDLKESIKAQKFELQGQINGALALAQLPPQPAPFVRIGPPEEASYDQARALIERDQYDRALAVLDRVIQAKGNRVDAAMYWKAYSLSKLARQPEALTVLSDLQKEYPNGAWLRDARALEVEIRQASGQSVSADVADDDVKLLALRGLMQSDPEVAVPAIERILQGNSSVRVKDRALFVLNQNRSTRARDIVSGVARSASNPELRLSAVKYLGQRSDPESIKILADMYASTNDVDVRRQILRSLGAANARDRLLGVAKSEKSPELRAIAVQQLGAARGGAELEELYRSETDKEVKQRILNSFVAANATDKLAAIARSEKDPDLQRVAIRSLGATNRPEALDALMSIYQSDAPLDTKRSVIQALSIHQNCSGLVGLAKSEKNPDLRREIVQRLSNQANRCSEARDYMLELLK